MRPQSIRQIQTSKTSRQHAASPTMQQMRKPFESRNQNTLYELSS